jgi:hypothetical protein
LASDNIELKVAWYNKRTDAISEMGGVGSLDWIVMDETVITVSYENALTSEEQFDELERWTLENWG